MSSKSALHITIFVIRFVLFILSINIFIAIGTIALHELGHSVAAGFYGCTYDTKLFVPGELPNTNIACFQNSHLNIITFGGVIATSIFAVAIFFSATGIIRYLAAIMFSVGIIAATIDLRSLSISGITIILLSVFSYVILAFSTIKIACLYYKKEMKLK